MLQNTVLDSTTTITPETLPSVFWQSKPVITTELLAIVYGTDVIRIQQNFNRNLNRFTEGVHYFLLKGADLKGFKTDYLKDSLLNIGKKANSLMLWTERGTVRHAKMLGTDKAWDVQDRLEDCYFAVKEQSPYGLKHPVIDPVYSPIHLTYKMKQQINGAVNYQTGLSGVTQEVIYGNLKREFGYEKIETADITLYPEICQRLGIPASEPIPEYLWVEGVEFKRLRDESAELESLKTDPTPLLICNETELWTKVTNDDVIIPFVEFEKMSNFIESHQQAKDSITQSIKQAFDEIDTSENIMVGRQRWNELNFIVKKVMANPQALAIL